jgi:Fic family protein
MKIPTTSPDPHKTLSELIEKNPDKAYKLFAQSEPVDNKGRYLHWEKLKHIEPPKDLTSEEWWAGVKFARQKLYKNVYLFDKNQDSFRFSTPDSILKDLHWLDQNTSGRISADEQVINPQMKNTYLMSSLVNEAINSSQLEGAATTWQDAKEMIRQSRKPKDYSEQMIFNNYKAMQFIRELKGEKLTPSIIFELHRILTEKTLKDQDIAGKLRTKTDKVYVVDSQHSKILHEPPNADELAERIKLLCKFANEERPKVFIHPILKAILLHFMMGYDHPFIDGNGRTARALFYWAASNKGYWLMDFISISQIIKQAPAQYGKAFLYSECDENDTTYFIVHQLSVIKKAIKNLFKYINKKTEEINEAQKILSTNTKLKGKLNYRQLALLKHAFKHPNFVYKINEHQKSHNIVNQTARKDLLTLSDELKLLIKREEGKGFIFISPVNLIEKIEKIKF